MRQVEREGAPAASSWISDEAGNAAAIGSEWAEHQLSHGEASMRPMVRPDAVLLGAKRESVGISTT